MPCISNFRFSSSIPLFCSLASGGGPLPAPPGGQWCTDLVDRGVTFDACGNIGGGIKTDGTLWLWGGNNSRGTLADNTGQDRSSPVQTISGGTNWKSLSLSQFGGAAIKTDGTLWGWGRNSGVLGQGDSVSTSYTSSPVQTVSGGTDWRQVSRSSHNTAAIKTDGTLWIWGYSSNGRLGNNSGASGVVRSPVQTISGGNNWCRATAGGNHNAAIKTDGTLWLWGSNSSGPNFTRVATGQIGDCSNAERSSPVQTVSGGSNWCFVKASVTNTFAIKTDGTLWGWGANSNGELGDGTNTPKSSPVQTVSGGTNWCFVTTGGLGDISYTLNSSVHAIKTDGTLWGWGINRCRKLGTADTNARSSPVQTVSGGSNWRIVSAGYYSASAVNSQGQSISWGSSVTGNMGVPNCFQTGFVPIDFDDVFVRKEFFNDGGLWLAGTSTGGRLGNNNNATNFSSPVQTISGGTNWRQISVGQCNSAGVKTDGTLWVWGYGRALGNGDASIANRSSPVQTISGGTNWRTVSVGERFMTAIKTDGSLWTWGNNSRGALGNQGGNLSCSSPVQTISGGNNWASVCAGFESVAAIKTDGTLWNWGLGFCGALGNNSTADQSSPVQTVSGGTNWKQVSTGRSHKAAIKTDGTLWSWGRGFDGALGNNVGADLSSPVQTISGGTNWKQVSAGGSPYFTAAIKTDGTLWMWGSNFGGQLGINSAWPACIGVSSPVQTITGGTNWKCVSAASASFQTSSVAAIKTDGTLWVWGGNTCGLAGTNTVGNISSPVQTITGGTNWMNISVGQDHLAAIREGCW